MRIERLLALPIPRMVFAAFWLLILLAGARQMRRRQVPSSTQKPVAIAKTGECPPASLLQLGPHYSAVREMAVNHRIQESDVDWASSGGKDLNKADFLGRYLACGEHAGDPLVLDTLRGAPSVQSSAGKMVYVLPMEQPGKGGSDLDVGSQMDIFEASKPLLRKVLVLAVQCGEATAVRCSVLLDMTPSEGALLLQADPEKVHIVRLHP